MSLTAQNYIGVFGIDVEQNGGNIRELLFQTGAEFFGAGQF